MEELVEKHSLEIAHLTILIEKFLVKYFGGLSSIFIISEKVANEGIGEHIDFIISTF
ncbi:hypothetical protein KHA80_22475 [Anaerobacillus sp. HL2]|nr:hypothetical protein KHA80_22475 [Anaerobacillus sp. HL2]